MKKKPVGVIIIGILFAMLVSSCSEAQTAQPQETSQAEENFLVEAEMTNSFSFGDRTGIYTGQVNNEGIPDGVGTFSSISDSGSEWTYTGNWNNGHWTSNGTSMWDTGAEYCGDYLDDLTSGYGIYKTDAGAVLAGHFSDVGILDGYGMIYFPDGMIVYGYFEDGIGTCHPVDDPSGKAYYFDGNTLYLDDDSQESAADKPTISNVEDFFSDPDRSATYEDLYTSYQYSELKAYLQEYISSKSPAESDSAYSALDILEPCLQYESIWQAVTDDFDGSISVIFPEAKEISDSVAVVPSLEEMRIHIRFGFIRPDWLFFDRLEISVDGEVKYSAPVKSYDATRNVLDGGDVEEYISLSPQDSVLEAVGAGDTVVVRFSNSDSEEYLDHTLSQSEKDAMYCSLLLRTAYRELDDLQFAHQ